MQEMRFSYRLLRSLKHLWRERHESSFKSRTVNNGIKIRGIYWALHKLFKISNMILRAHRFMLHVLSHK